MILSPVSPWWRATARMAPRAWQALAMATMLVALAACGPGIGGTGTGDDIGPTAFGASEAPVCASALGAALACPGALPGTPTAVGTAEVVFAGGSGADAVQARFQGNTVQIEWPCRSLQFRGQFGRAEQDDALQGRYYGSLGAAGAADGSPTVAAVEALPDAALQLTLLDAAGQLVWGPFTLRRSDGAGPPASCP